MQSGLRLHMLGRLRAKGLAEFLFHFSLNGLTELVFQFAVASLGLFYLRFPAERLSVLLLRLLLVGLSHLGDYHCRVRNRGLDQLTRCVDACLH